MNLQGQETNIEDLRQRRGEDSKDYLKRLLGMSPAQARGTLGFTRQNKFI